MTPRTTGPAAPAQAEPHSRRRIRNYLIDPRFQFKYTGLLVAFALSLLVALGGVIWKAVNTAAKNAQDAATQAENAMRESQTSSRLMRMDAMMRADDNPELIQTIERELASIDAEAARNQARVAAQRVAIERDRKRTLTNLIVGGAALVVLLTLMGVYITSKIVGPVFKLKRLLRRVGTGRLAVKERLRKGDELEDLFDTFLQMTYSLKALQMSRLATLDLVIRRAEATGADPEVLDGLRVLRMQMCLGIGGSLTSPRPQSMPPPRFVASSTR